MSAREALLDALMWGIDGDQTSAGLKQSADKLIKAFAHELAEEIRDNIGRADYPHESQHVKDLVAFGRAQADLIDSEVES